MSAASPTLRISQRLTEGREARREQGQPVTQANMRKLNPKLAELRKRAQESQERMYQSLREVLAVREHGGAVQKEDEHGVIRISVDAKGSPEEIRVEPDWENYYEASQLTGALSALVQLIDQERQKHAAEHLERHPEALDKITDEEIEKAFGAVQIPSVSVPDDPVSALGDIIERYPKMKEEVDAQANREQNSINESTPVQVIIISGMLASVVIDEMFAQDASVTKINAELATALEQAKNPDLDENSSLKARLIEDAAQARAIARSLLANLQARNNNSTER